MEVSAERISAILIIVGSGLFLCAAFTPISFRVFPERSAGIVAERARQLMGDGPTVVEGQESGRDALAPYLALAAAVLLGLLLWRRDR